MAAGHGGRRRRSPAAAWRAASKVVWTAEALCDPGAIRARLHPLNPVAARKIAQALVLAGDSLSLFPGRDRIGPEPGTRELVAARPCVLVYEVKGAEAVILAVWHGAQER